MASIATGLDFDTGGAKKSTGAKMRTFTDDQSGGTDSGDARQAWNRGYNESLTVRDGNPWSTVLSDLRAGRLVHLDVWHATVGGPCLSGSGGYGHTMAVLPDCSGDAWLVADPWCSPPKWVRVSEAKLKAGAEEWGRRVYTTATKGPGWPRTGDPTGEVLRQLLAAAARDLMTRFHAGGPEDDSPDPETGGAQRVLSTVTVARPLKGAPTDMGIFWNPARWTATKDIPVFLDVACTVPMTTLKTGAKFTSLGVEAEKGGDGRNAAHRAVLVVTNAMDGTPQEGILWTKDADYPSGSDSTSQEWDDSIWRLALDPAGRYPAPPCPECPDCPPPPDTDEVIAAALRARDSQWREALQGGQPWPTSETKETAP